MLMDRFTGARPRTLAWALAACTLVPTVAAAQAPALPLSAPSPDALTADRVLTLARAQAARVAASQFSGDEARARAAAARAYQGSPEVETYVGPSRAGDASRTTDVEWTLTQPLDIGARRRARAAEADAGVGRAEAASRDLTRTLVLDAMLTFVRVQHVQQRLRVLTDAEAATARLLAIAERRYAAGDVAVLDVNVARAALARARADVASTQALAAEAAGRLRPLLGLPLNAVIHVDASFTDPPTLSQPVPGVAAPGERVPGTPAFAQALDAHPALAVLRADVADADARLAAARAMNRPALGASTRFTRSGDDRAVFGGLIVTLPLFTARGDVESAAVASLARARLALEVRRDALAHEIQSTSESYRWRATAAATLAREALPGLEENERLAARSYEAGELDLSDTLIVRQQALDMRLQYLDRVLDTLTARTMLQSAAGDLP